ncbi:hypothetical protein B296_00008584 [Ensete ventricosum]|uniref:Uncharacterized protein n=1 Tax=Ensete ventricosum TaxID=4639 RepID=A0A426ZM05_ENSVE|nr:hypothetical protein B296_00008584 [Ensete ventricosum]
MSTKNSWENTTAKNSARSGNTRRCCDRILRQRFNACRTTLDQNPRARSIHKEPSKPPTKIQRNTERNRFIPKNSKKRSERLDGGDEDEMGVPRQIDGISLSLALVNKGTKGCFKDTPFIKTRPKIWPGSQPRPAHLRLILDRHPTRPNNISSRAVVSRITEEHN